MFENKRKFKTTTNLYQSRATLLKLPTVRDKYNPQIYKLIISNPNIDQCVCKLVENDKDLFIFTVFATDSREVIFETDIGFYDTSKLSVWTDSTNISAIAYFVER